MRVMGRQVVSSRYRLVREVRFLCRSGGFNRLVVRVQPGEDIEVPLAGLA
jgi:hypothetical protein